MVLKRPYLKDMRIIISDFPTASRKEFSESYGTWFPASVNPEQLIARCEEQMQNCQKWIENLQQLKAEAQKMLFDSQKDKLKTYLNLLTEEEREQFLKN